MHWSIWATVFQATQLEQIAPETYETAIRYLQQGLKLSEWAKFRVKLCGLGICPLSSISTPSSNQIPGRWFTIRNFQAICISGFELG